MKKRILILLIPMLLLVGCSYFKDYDYPFLIEQGINDSAADNITICIPQAKTGLQGYEIVETESGVDVVLHYLKKEKN